MADIYKLFGDPKMVFNLELLLRILLGGFMGAIIGHERKSRDKSAGMRTHAIVGLGAALIMIVSKYGFGDVPDFDASRVAAQIVSGVGFLGGGNYICEEQRHGQRADDCRRHLDHRRCGNGPGSGNLFL